MQGRTQASGSACTGRIDVHEVEQASAVAGNMLSVYIAEVCVMEAANGSVVAAANQYYDMQAAGSTPHNFAQDLQQPQLPQHNQSMLQRHPPHNYAHAFPPHRRGLGLGSSDSASSVAAPAAILAPLTWQTLQTPVGAPFSAFDGSATLAPWGWGEGAE